MLYDKSSIRKAFFIGLILTGLGVFLKIDVGWNEGTILCLIVGPFLLLCSLVIVLFYARVARGDTSQLPEDWENFSLEAKRNFARKQFMQNYNRSSLITHQLIRLNQAQRRSAKDSTKQ